MFYLNLILILAISWFLGQDRAKAGKAIGFRSLCIVMLGAYCFTYSAYMPSGGIDYHVIAQIVSGISFVGAGLIFKDKSVHNLTTAILAWASASIAVLLGLNKILEAVTITIIIRLVLLYKKKEKCWKNDFIMAESIS